MNAFAEFYKMDDDVPFCEFASEHLKNSERHRIKTRKWQDKDCKKPTPAT